MRISYLASAVLAIWLLPLSTPAYAGCSSGSCASSANTVTYGSGSYSSSTYGSGTYGTQSTSSNFRSNAHVSQGIGTRFGAASTAAFAQRSTATARNSYGKSYASTSSSTGQVVPFTTTVSKISNHRVAGMASNEFLSPTTCPTNVYNPGGNKVLGCYKVVKPVQTIRPVPVIRPAPQIHYQQIRVVRPIIYVRYPVPTPMPMPVPVCRTQTVCGGGCSSTTYSRYGNTWPRGGYNCGGW